MSRGTYFTVIGYSVSTDRSPRGRSSSRAEVTLKVGSVTVHGRATGVGPVHALDNALRECLVPYFPEVERIELADYRVTVVGATRGTGSDVHVSVAATDGARRWDAGCTSQNIVDASFEALCSTIVMGLMRSDPIETAAI
jgi:2-isopropylmalate synthase